MFGAIGRKGDLDLDGDVDAFDLSWFANEYGQTEIDIDNDGDTFSEIWGDCDDTDDTEYGIFFLIGRSAAAKAVARQAMIRKNPSALRATDLL